MVNTPPHSHRPGVSPETFAPLAEVAAMNLWAFPAGPRVLRAASLGLLLLIPTVSAAAGPARPAPPVPGAVAKSIDQLLADHWQRLQVTPAPAADDTTLYRRVMLDLA